MIKKFSFILCTLLLIGVGCTVKKNVPPDQQKGKVQVAVSIYPIAHFVQKVGGDVVNVQLITPGGVEPHDYEPTPSDIIKIESSDVFILNGAGVDTWAENIAESLSKKNIPVLNMANALRGDFQFASLPDEGHEDELPEFDPHIWLDPILVKDQIISIQNILIQIDSAHATTYQKNADAYLAELSALDKEYTDGLSQCQRKEIIVSHDAFGYLGARYGITIYSIAGLSPEEEPSPARLAELTRLIREKNLSTVFFESLVSSKLAHTLTQETGAKSAVLNPIEGLTLKESQAGKNYDILMKENLENLQNAMLCQ